MCSLYYKQRQPLLCQSYCRHEERCDQASQYANLKNGRPIQERLAKRLHQEARVEEGPCGFQGLEKVQEFLGVHGYQLIVIEPSKCFILFKDPAYNTAPHSIAPLKFHHHYDGLSSIPALLNRSYYCRLCDGAYNVDDTQNHDCRGQNCPACLRKNNSCPNYAAWIHPQLEYPHCDKKFYGQDCFNAHQLKRNKKEDKSLCKMSKKCLIAVENTMWTLKNPINVVMLPVEIVESLNTWIIDVSFNL